MARCVYCGKNGLFVSVDSDGLCRSCASSIRGEIRYYGLIPFWISLTPQERDKSIGASIAELSARGAEIPLITGDVSFSSASKTSFLSSIGYNLISKKEYSLSEKYLLLAEQANSNIIDMHFCYNHLIELTYKQRENPHYLNMSIGYCIKDINMFPQFSDAYQRKYPTADGSIDIWLPSFQQLAIIYEKQGHISEAIKVCEAAIFYGLKDSTKGGFEGRITKLQKKL